MLLACLALLTHGQSTPLSKQHSKPSYSHARKHDPRDERFVFMGAGPVVQIEAQLKARNIDVMKVGWLLWPEEAMNPERPLLDRQNLENHDWEGLAVDISNYKEARSLMLRNGHFKLLAEKVGGPDYYFPAPPDDYLVANFKRHREGLESLAAMARADLKGVPKGAYWRMDRYIDYEEAPRARYQSYKQVLTKANVKSVGRDGDGNLDFMCWSFGATITSEYSKGYKYLPNSHPKTMRSLDGWETKQKESGIVFRHLDGPWYLYSDFVP